MEILENNSIVKRNDQRFINETRGTGARNNKCLLSLCFIFVAIAPAFISW